MTQFVKIPKKTKNFKIFIIVLIPLLLSEKINKKSKNFIKNNEKKKNCKQIIKNLKEK